MKRDEGVGLGCLGVICGCLASIEVGEEAEGVGLVCVGRYMWPSSLHGGW